MKKKIFSLLLGICLIFGGMFAFSGCSIYTPDSEKKNGNIVMKIGDTDVTKNDLINAFYTYYQNNSNYFSYYDQETIEQSFYTWFTVKTMVNELSFKALYDEKTNPTGYIYYTNEDAKTVWGYVEDYFYSQISTYEKALLTAQGKSEDEYPEWLKSDSSSDSKTKFEFYTSPTKDIKFTDRRADVTKKLTDDEVYAKVAELKSNLFKYVTSTDDDGNETKADIMDDGLIVRNQAYANYVQALVSNAKASGKSTTVDDVIKAEVLRIYKAYYDSQISVIFQNYYVQEQLLDYNGQGDKSTLNDSAVVASFLDKYYTDMQTNQIQDAYVSTMESKDGASLVLYHYKGRNYYFSVQHVLVKFTDYLQEQVEAIDGYGVTNANAIIAKTYTEARDKLATDYKQAILTKVNTDNEKKTIISVGDYYYYDESKREVFDASKNIFYGYVKLSSHTFDVDGKPVYSYTDYQKDPETTITHESDGVSLMATVEDVVDAFENNYKVWVKLAEEVYSGTKTIDEIIKANEKQYEDLEYVLQVAKNMKEIGSSLDELKSKVGSLLFIELEWIYSGDSLENKVSNKIGYIVSNKPDNNMSWVVDFAVGAREMIAGMNDSAYTSLSADQKAVYTKQVITDYGYHIMKIENVYNNSSIIDIESITDDYDLDNDSEYVKNIVKLLKKTYICTSSNETLYDYFYDQVYNTLVGTSSSSGTYFLALEYKWLNKFYTDNKIEIIKKMTYDELFASLS